MATTCAIDLDKQKLRDEIRSIYARVATDPSGNFHFHRGPKYAAELEVRSRSPRRNHGRVVRHPADEGGAAIMTERATGATRRCGRSDRRVALRMTARPIAA